MIPWERTDPDFGVIPGDHPLIKYFTYQHLPADLARVSRHFHDTAAWLAKTLPEGSEKTVAIRKLLEAKDAAVRSMAVDGMEN